MGMNNLKKSLILSPFNLLYHFSPTLDLKLIFRLRQGYSLNLKAPVTYSEKLQWIKLYNHNPYMPICCDKYAVRDYVQKKGLGNILNELLWEGTEPEQIPFDQLPKQFVIKVTHGSTFNIICKDKEKLDTKETVKKCRRWLRAKFLPCYGEWFYGVVPPRIIIEKYLEDNESSHKDLIDYKVYCFHGQPKIVQVISDRFSDIHDTIYDNEWRLLKDVNLGYPCTNQAQPKPNCFLELIEASRRLSEDFLHARVDFYIVNGKLYFGEITFTSGAGFDRLSTYEVDKGLGDFLKLPEITKC